MVSTLASQKFCEIHNSSLGPQYLVLECISRNEHCISVIGRSSKLMTITQRMSYGGQFIKCNRTDSIQKPSDETHLLEALVT